MSSPRSPAPTENGPAHPSAPAEKPECQSATSLTHRPGASICGTCPRSGKNRPRHGGCRRSSASASAAGTSRSRCPCRIRTGPSTRSSARRAMPGRAPQPQHRSCGVEEGRHRFGVVLPLPKEVGVQAHDVGRDRCRIGRDVAEGQVHGAFGVQDPGPRRHEGLADPRKPVRGEGRNDRRGGGVPPYPGEDRPGEHHARHRRGLHRRLQNDDCPAHRVPAEHHISRPELGDESRDRPPRVHEARGPTGSRRPPEPRQIQGQDPAEPRESGGCLDPTEMGPAQPVDNDEGGLVRPVPHAVGHGSVEVDRADLGKLERHVPRVAGRRHRTAPPPRTNTQGRVWAPEALRRWEE